MLSTPLLPWRLIGAAVAGLALTGGGYWLGSTLVHAEWAKEVARQAELERQRIEHIRDQMDRNEKAAHAAAQQFEAERQKLEATHVQALRTLRKALGAPLSCPPGATLGDLVLPAAALDGLRHASGTDRVPAPEPAASEPDR